MYQIKRIGFLPIRFIFWLANLRLDTTRGLHEGDFYYSALKYAHIFAYDNYTEI